MFYYCIWCGKLCTKINGFFCKGSLPIKDFIDPYEPDIGLVSDMKLCSKDCHKDYIYEINRIRS